MHSRVTASIRDGIVGFIILLEMIGAVSFPSSDKVFVVFFQHIESVPINFCVKDFPSGLEIVKSHSSS